MNSHIKIISIEKMLRETLSTFFDDPKQIDNINEDTLFLEIGLSSINIIQLIVKIEEHFDITFDDEEMLEENFQSINRTINIIEQKIDLEAD